MDPRIEAILSKRADYERERKHHRFLLDAYAGTGGFRGREKLPTSSWWGWGADAYTDDVASLLGRETNVEEIDTYLDRFDREDAEKFARRVDVAQYPNHVANVVDIPLSYFHRKELARELPDSVLSWMEDVTGDDDVTSWDDLRSSTIDLRALVLGYCPVMLWAPSAPSGLSRAQAEEMRIGVRARPMFPANLYDWEVDRDGNFVWVKVGICYSERLNPMGKTDRVEVVSIWYRDRVEEYEIRTTENEEPRITREETRGHSWGAVPIVVFRWRPLPDDSVRGVSAIESSATMARRLFNYLSELDEHIRRCVFSVLQVPIKDHTKIGEVLGGNGSGIAVPPDSTRDIKWISPTPEVATILEKRIEETRGDIYRQGRIEFTQATSGAARSGVSRAFEFETANRTIADFAKRTARAEERLFRILARALPGQVEASAIRVTPPEKFSVEDAKAMLEEFQLAIDMSLGSTATVEIKKRVVGAMLPNLSPEKMDTIESELEDVEREAEEARKTERAMTAAMVNASDDEDESDDEDDDGDEEADQG